ncbi:hypothetical protein WJX73_001044 [Symbiochloris irregularis]|uniref:BHLH domain-containing protein n=1 Tax=Symbiochloris irregularis TaxID=706552 RepID=A0AAW1NR66_9CHLO
MSDKAWEDDAQRPHQQDGDMTYWPDALLYSFAGDDLGQILPPGQAAASAPEEAQATGSGALDEAALRKRKREQRADQESMDAIMAQLGREDEDDSPFEDKRAFRAGSGSKTTAASAARNKACRERQRRERLNDRFTELAKVLEPGKTAKTDKTNIIDDAMRIVTQLRGENGQLRQLNKFLEERVSQHAAHVRSGRSAIAAAGTDAIHHKWRFSSARVWHGSSIGPAPNAGPHADRQSRPAAAPKPSFVKPEFPQGLLLPGGLQFTPNMGSWLPPSTLDTSQDSIRRPPAA